MNWESALTEIESHEFDANLSVVSGVRAFYRAAANEPACVDLYSNMLASGEAREEVLGHILDLSQLEVDRRFENPKDTSLAILLWLTNFAAPELVEIAADLVDRAPNCWYAKKLAHRILVHSPTETDNLWVGAPPAHKTSSGGSSGDVFLRINAFSSVPGRIGPGVGILMTPSTGIPSTTYTDRIDCQSPG